MFYLFVSVLLIEYLSNKISLGKSDTHLCFSTSTQLQKDIKARP